MAGLSAGRNDRESVLFIGTQFSNLYTADLDSAGNSVLVTAMFCKWCEMSGFKHNNRGKPAVWTDAGGGCQRAKLESVKDHEGTSTHKEAANLQMNQSDMKEAVKTAILQHNHVLLNLTSIILSMAKNHDSAILWEIPYWHA